MNQDHLQQQPAADKYNIGGPSEFAEDVHPSSDTWEAEETGGETNRNEIGLPEFRGDSFKTGGVDMETLNKKGEVCIIVARHMLPNADETTLEFQAATLMHLPDKDLVETAERVKTAGKIPPEFLEQQKKMKDKAKAKGKSDDDDESDDKGKEAAEQQDAQGDKDQDDKDQDDKDQDDKGKEAGCGDREQMFSMGQVQDMVNQAVATAMGQQGTQQQGGQQVQNDDQILDQMLQDDAPVQLAPDMDIQLEGAPMDIGEVQMGAEDQVLNDLFASSPEVRQAQQAQALQEGMPVAPMPPIKTASTRTVGTRPSGGVSQIGGAGAPADTSGNDVNALSGMWKSAPDVSGVFNPEG